MSDVFSLPTAVHGLASAVVDDTIYFAGGATGGWNIQTPLDHFDIYNTTSKTWSQDRLSIPRTYLTLSKVGHRLVFAGGASRLRDGPALPSTRIDIFDTLTRTWSTLELNEPRFAHVATTYGDKVFVAGGLVELGGSNMITVDSVEMIDLATNNVSIIYRMSTPRYAQSSGTVMDVVFFASGRHRINVNVPEVFMYNVTANEWRVEMLPLARTYTSAAVYGKKIYIAGGWVQNLIATNRVDIFDIETRQWSDPVLLESARGLMSAVVLDTKIYLAGGIGVLFESLVDVIDAETGERLSIRLKEPRAMMTAPTDGKRIYFAGGLVNEFSNSDVIEVFDSHGIIDEIDMPRARTNFASATANQLVFFAGGTLSDGSHTDSVDIYDERTEQWFEARLSVPRAGVISAVLGPRVFFIGGVDSANNSVAAIDIYNTLTRQWTTAQLSQSRVQFSVVTDNTSLYIAGGALIFGDRASPVSDVVDIYDSRTNRWTTAKLSAARSRVSSFAHQSVVFFAGGSSEYKMNDEVDIYGTVTNTWTVARLRVGRAAIGIGAVLNQVVFAGGLLFDDFSTRAMDIYDTATGQWRFSQLTVPRFDLSVLTFNNYLIIGGGIGNSVATVVEIYNADTGVLTDSRILLTRHNTLVVSMGSTFIFAGGFFINGGRERLAQSSAIEVFDTNSAGSFSSYFLSKNITWRHAVVSHNKIYFSGDDYAKMNVMVMPSMEQLLASQQQFLGRQVTFNATVLGRGLTYSWTHNDERIANVTGSSYTIDEVTTDSNGLYTLTAVDMCRNRVLSSAQLEVLIAPTFAQATLQDTVVLCGSSVTLSAPARGVDVQYEWYFDEQQQFNYRHDMTVQAPPSSCDASHRVCIIATNPAGATAMCALLRMSSYNNVFDGPTVANNRPSWLLGDNAEISVNLLDPLCTSHEWRKNGVVVQTETGTKSTLVVKVGSSTDSTVYSVVAYCGAPVESRPVKLDVVYLYWWGVLLIALSCAGAIAGGIVAFVQIRKRFQNKQEREQELKELLDDAKRAVINTSSTTDSVINVRRWEWIPDDNYRYVPVSDLPFTIDTTNVLFLKKNQQLEIGICMQGDMIFAFKSAKNSKTPSSLKEKLLRRSMQVSIYPPRSPKYEMTVDPQHFAIGPDDEVRVLVSLTMKMTTKAKINLIIGLEEQELYSAIEFNVASKISPWIDADEVIIQGDPIGMGGYKPNLISSFC